MIYLRQTPIPDPQGQTETVHGYLNKKKTQQNHTHTTARAILKNCKLVESFPILTTDSILFQMCGRKENF